MNNAVYEKRIVAFVDILGFSTMIEDSKADVPLRRKIKKAVEMIQRAAESEYEDKKGINLFRFCCHFVSPSKPIVPVLSSNGCHSPST